ncbi:MAG TPA: hypothetical protein VEC18_12215 [Myxococcota bacterium]|nr:hypothetical protein [Myxococcota bacterium]
MFSRRFPRIHRALALALALFLAVGLAGAATSAEKEKKKKADPHDKGKDFTVSEQTNKKLTEAIEAIEATDFTKARTVLGEMEKRAQRLRPYERALVYQFLGNVEATQDKYPEALVYFEKALAEEALPHEHQISIRFSVAQLYLAGEQPEKAIKALEAWFKEVETPTAVAYYSLAVAYYQLEQIDNAIPPAEKCIELAKKPKAAWLQLLVGLYYEAKQFAKAVKPLEMLIMVDPKKAYWTQLSSLYAHLEQEAKSLAVMQLAYAQDYLEKDSDLRALAQLYLYHSLPYQAALVLEKGRADGYIENNATYWEMLANAWVLAREYDRALEPLATGAEISEKGDLYTRLGQLLLEREDWTGAEDALKKAIAKGKLTDEHAAHLLLAIAYYQQEQYSASMRHLRVASGSHTEMIRNSATQWMVLVERDASEAAGGEQEEPLPQSEHLPASAQAAAPASAQSAASASEAAPAAPGSAPSAEEGASAQVSRAEAATP